MLQFLHRMVAAVAACVLIPSAVLGQQQPVKVILMGGQSNMEGFGLSFFLPDPLKAPQNDVLFYVGATSGAGQPGNPLNSDTLMNLQPTTHGGAYFGPEITFGRALADADPGQQYAIIKYAYQGTSLHHDWSVSDPNNTHYDRFHATVAGGMQALADAGYAPEISGMLWLQGEADALGTGEHYKQDLTNFIADYRNLYGDELPFVIGGIGYLDSPGRAVVMGAQAELATELVNVAYFSNDDLNPGQELHFDHEQMQAIGQRYAAAFQAMAVAPEPSGGLLLGVAALLVARRKQRGGQGR